MRQEGHLQIFDLILETRSPLFIGNGKSYTKKEYIFDPKSGEATFLDEGKMFAYLAGHGLADDYEGYVLRGTSRDLRDFLLNTCKIPQTVINTWVRARVDTADALDEHHTLKEIQRFVRDGSGQIYVPGSSLKGAIRTALLKSMILNDPQASNDLSFDFEKHYFHTLTLKKDKNQQIQTGNALNSILQGIRISDSRPIPDRCLCLTTKIDEFTDDSYNKINICRESIKPGTKIYGTMTLDQSILHGAITREIIEKAIADASAHYRKTVTAHYPQASNYMDSRTILLGGGVGFQSKTIVGTVCGKQELEETVRILSTNKMFKAHHHENDVRDGISPRALKQTDFNGAAYPYGVCEVLIR